MLDHFMSKVSPEPNSGCWLWTDRASRGGYGQFWDNQKYEAAHRVAYRLFCGEIPDGLIVRHKCDVSACVNPDHLLVGTHADNEADKVRRNRQAKGEKHGTAVLDEDKVKAIRASKLGQRELARQYGVSQSTIWRARNTRWLHVMGNA